MTEVKIRKLRKIYGVCMGVFTVVVGMLFIIQVWSIFRSTSVNPYTVESVTNAFSQIAVPVWLWILAVIAGAFIPAETERPTAYVDMRKALLKLKNRLPQGAEVLGVSRGRKILRSALYIACAVLCAISCVVGLVMLLDMGYRAEFTAKFFQTHVEAEKLVRLTPWILGSLALCAGAVAYDAYCLKQELTAVKAAIAENAKKGVKTVTPAQPIAAKEGGAVTFGEKLGAKLYEKIPFLKTEKFTAIVRISLAVIGVVFVVFGIFNGGMADVLTKAINICTQCIGLG